MTSHFSTVSFRKCILSSTVYTIHCTMRPLLIDCSHSNGATMFTWKRFREFWCRCNKNTEWDVPHVSVCSWETRWNRFYVSTQSEHTDFDSHSRGLRIHRNFIVNEIHIAVSPHPYNSRTFYQKCLTTNQIELHWVQYLIRSAYDNLILNIHFLTDSNRKTTKTQKLVVKGK